MANSWPPVLVDLRRELGRKDADTADDDLLESVLAACVAFVERVHRGRFNFLDDDDSELPPVPGDMRLGTLYLAKRWHARRRSPDGLLNMAEFGAARIPSFDTDIERMLQVGKYARPAFA